jgi:DNA modification methylase
MTIQTNDIYKLGDHLLACGDSSNAELLQRLIGDKKISTVVCDPPYGVDVVASKSAFSQQLSCNIGIANDHEQTDTEYEIFCSKWLSAIKPHLAPKNSIYIFNCDKMIFSLRNAMLKTGYKLSQLLVWIKSQPVLGRLDYLPQHELIAYGWHCRHYFRRSKDKSVLFSPKPSKSKLHPTMKPVGLIRNLILNSTKIGEYVFDGFAGSGTTIIACEHTKRKCITIELNLIHCSTIIKRYESLTGNQAIKI